jgi:hypothetical protein
MKLEDIHPKMRVIYIPSHAHGDRNHPDAEHGCVSSVNDHYAFVKFNKQVAILGWDDAGAPACRAEDLERD